jgi:S-adenosylmethionine hydrolase
MGETMMMIAVVRHVRFPHVGVCLGAQYNSLRDDCQKRDYMDLPIIALLTDFGVRDAYVGTMKGVMLGIAPAAQFVDLTHDVAPQQVREGAWLLANVMRHFPPGTLFLAVVDPGVGSERRPVAAVAGGYQFVGPDNGLLWPALKSLGRWRAVALTNPAYRLATVSSTFHGRDLFAPAAAHLAQGVPLEALGPAVDDLIPLPAPRLEAGEHSVRGEVMRVDRFGNLETSIGPLRWRDADVIEWTAGSTPLVFEAARARIGLPGSAAPPLQAIRRTYSAVSAGQLLALIGSAGFLEVGCNGGSAAEQTGARPGDPIELTWE